MCPNKFPPHGLQDLNKRSAANLLSLARTLAIGPCTVLTGAGVSASCGLPNWNKLLKNIASIYFTHWQFELSNNSNLRNRPPKDVSIAFVDSFMWNEESIALAETLVAKADALSVAQMILSRVAESNRQYLIRQALYGELGNSIAPSPLTKSVAENCAIYNVSAAVSYNYDDIFERALRAIGVSVSPLWGAEMVPSSESMPIFYPHGYLKQGGGPLVPIVLGEDDYHAYAIDGYGWRNLIQLRQLSATSCIFVGCSLGDPHLRRLLWVAKRGASRSHFAFLPSYAAEDSNDAMLEALADAQLFDLGVRVIRYPILSSEDRHGRLVSLLGLLIEAANNPDALWM